MYKIINTVYRMYKNENKQMHIIVKLVRVDKNTKKSVMKDNFALSVRFKNIKSESYKGPIAVVKLIKCIFEETKILNEKSYFQLTDDLDTFRQFVKNSNNSIIYHEDFKNCKAMTIIKENMSKNYQSDTENLVIEINPEKTISALVLLFDIFRLMLLYLRFARAAVILKIMVDVKYILKKIKVKIKGKDQKFYLYPIMLLQTTYSI